MAVVRLTGNTLVLINMVALHWACLVLGWVNRRDTESYCRAACVLELLTVKRNILYIPDNFLTNSPKDINDMLYSLCTSRR